MSNNNTSFDYSDLSWAEVPVKVGNQHYTLREASEDAVRQWQNKAAGMSRFGEGGKFLGAHGPIADLQGYFVHLCLFNDAGKNVPLETVRGWPSRIVRQLFAKAQQISGLNEPEEQSGNSSSDTVTG